MKRIRSVHVLATALAAGFSLGATNINPVLKFTWGENIGWVNWRGAGAQGVRVHATYLSGFAWAENVGWINFGDATPANGLAYGNAAGADAGVNIDPSTGNLFGMAWGENIGWINFDTRSALGAQGRQARLDYAANRLRGYAWGENVGWFNLDDASRYVAVLPVSCPQAPFADVDGDTDVDQDDFARFQTCWSGSAHPVLNGCECFDRPAAGLPRGDNDVDADDLAKFQACRSGPTIAANPACGQ